MRSLSWLRRALTLCVCYGLSLWLLENPAAQARLTIGSPAPSLDIEFWVQQGAGKFQPVTKFEKDKVYVVEFWATWCGPCIQSMPHLVELQKKYADGNLQIISISDEPLDEVKQFLQRPAGEENGKPVTFEELTSAYCLTTDPDGSSHLAYPQAANLNGIPCAFIVGKDAKIEWIGHPLEMDIPLAQVIEGKWDREAFATQFNEEQEFEAIQQTLARLLQSRSGTPPTPENIQKAQKALDDFIAGLKTSRIKSQAKFLRFDLMIQFQPESQELAKVAREVFQTLAPRPMELNTLAYGIYEISEAGHLKSRELVQEALAAVQATLPQVPKSQHGTIFDTIAHLQHYLGDLEAALQSAKEAAKAPDASAEAEAYVGKLEMELKSKKP